MKINVRIIIAIVLAAWGVQAEAQNACHYFTRGNAPIFATDSLARLDMVDYFEAGMATPSHTAWDGEALITDADPDGSWLTWSVDSTFTGTLAVVGKGKKTRLLIIETLAIPQADSRLSWYTTDWQPTEAPVDMPVLADWLTPEGAAHRNEVEAWLPYMTAVVTKANGKDALLFTNTLRQLFVTGDDLERIDKWIKPSITLNL